MRQTLIIACAALIAGLLAIWGANTILAKPQKEGSAHPAAASIDVMQMMKNAKDLPEQQFGAY
jgi:hypothetical protein